MAWLLAPILWLILLIFNASARVLVTFQTRRVLASSQRVYTLRLVGSTGAQRESWRAYRDDIRDLAFLLAAKNGLWRNMSSLVVAAASVLATLWIPLVGALVLSNVGLLSAEDWVLVLFSAVGFFVLLPFSVAFGTVRSYLGEGGVDAEQPNLVGAGVALFEALGDKYPHLPPLKSLYLVAWWLVLVGLVGVSVAVFA